MHPSLSSAASSIMVTDEEVRIGKDAVRKACAIASKVAQGLSKDETMTKEDRSPVTIADFAAQAVIIHEVKRAFPEDRVVGEEDAADLGQNEPLLRKVWELVKPAESMRDARQMLDAIDAGGYAGGAKGRMWALDPIDGTKGFLRGGQYAICLALIVDSEVRLGLIGCPNLSVQADGSSELGVLFTAVKGSGSFQEPLSGACNAIPIHMRQVKETAHASFCESVEAGHSAHGDQAEIAKELGIQKASVRMDSQAKYCSIARGDSDIYLRLPVSLQYEEKIWDHASGNLLVEEAGGRVTDMYGAPLDFGQGRTLRSNKGVVASLASIHPQVLQAVKRVLRL